ncbi:MAG: ubiquinone-binding protein [Gammaproteobacteria bacterium RIFCSPLOWO2_02_FULL_61_13]|nr:MAG: ubiquinone-binding protein [Gammaproteobacteria bacterium RIFCSPLOWO2_02_FULL_61_13]
MNQVRRTAIVQFSADQMYALVNDIDAYPEFLPWCSDARVLSRQDDTLTASVSMALGRIRHTFTTANTMQPGRQIAVRLLSGPFRRLEGSWNLTPAGDHACEIRLEMQFEFKNRLLELSLGKVFNQIVNSLVGAFARRAEQVYGRV